MGVFASILTPRVPTESMANRSLKPVEQMDAIEFSAFLDTLTILEMRRLVAYSFGAIPRDLLSKLERIRAETPTEEPVWTVLPDGKVKRVI